MSKTIYSGSVYEVKTRISYLQNVEKKVFSTYKEAKKYSIELKKCYPEIQIVSITEVKVHSTSV